MIRRVTRSKTLFMASYKPLFGLALATLLGSCVYVPPPEHYGGPPPPPDVPPPYHYDGVPPPPPEPDYYFGRGRGDRNYDFDYQRHRRGRTQYLREVDPDYAVESPESEGTMPPDEGAADAEPSPAPSPPPAPAPKIDPTTVPYGTRTNTPGRAKSPYPPYRELDVSGMKSGSMAKDPTTGKVFRVP